MEFNNYIGHDSLFSRRNLHKQNTTIPVDKCYSAFLESNIFLHGPKHKLPDGTVFDQSTKFVWSNRKTHVSRDLIVDNFHNNLSKEKLSSEQNQKGMPVSDDWYMSLKINNKSTWQLCFVVGGQFVISVIKYLVDLFIEYSEECSKPEIKYNYVKGAKEAKETLKMVVQSLKNPERLSALGAEFPKRFLLVGPQGAGTTLLAKAVAREACVPFFRISGPEFGDKYIGTKRVRELFKTVKDNIPCVIFIDEIDSVGKKRTSTSRHICANETINKILTEIDRLQIGSGVVVLGATNGKEDLHKALLKSPRRFDVEVTVLVPDFSERKELLDYYIGQISNRDINTEKLARGTTNFTGAEIENMVNEAALRAAEVGAPYVTMEHLKYARDKAIMGPENIYKVTHEETNKITAYHECGHAVVAYFTEHSQPLHHVTIIANKGSSSGHTGTVYMLEDRDCITKQEVLAMMDVMMGGCIAEELVFGSEKITSRSSSDLEKAKELASNIVKKWGMSEPIWFRASHTMTRKTANFIYSYIEIEKILQESYERAKHILITHIYKHIKLSEALLEHETLYADEISEIMNGPV